MYSIGQFSLITNTTKKALRHYDEMGLLTVVRCCTEIEKLTPATVHEFIDGIIVHEPEQARGDRLALKGLGA